MACVDVQDVPLGYAPVECESWKSITEGERSLAARQTHHIHWHLQQVKNITIKKLSQTMTEVTGHQLA